MEQSSDIELPHCVNIPEVPDIKEYGKTLVRRWNDKYISNIDFMVEAMATFSQRNLLEYGQRIWSCREKIVSLLRENQALKQENQQLKELCKKLTETT